MKPRFTNRNGHTLVEMMVAVTILSIFMVMVARAQQPFTKMIYGLQDRARASSELHLAVDWLTRDFGGAAIVTREDKNSLSIVREEAVAKVDGVRGADRGIQYTWRDGMLIREDRNRKQEFVVAADLVSFTILEARNELRIELVDGLEPEEHKLTLIWRQP